LPQNTSSSDYFTYLENNGNDGFYRPPFNDCHSCLIEAAEHFGGKFIHNQNYEGRLDDFKTKPFLYKNVPGYHYIP
jgi:hypothetical protein